MAERKKTRNKIERSFLSLVQQLLLPEIPSKVRLKTSDNEDDAVINYTPRTGIKLAQDVCVLAQVHSLLCTGKASTKRDLYYEHKTLYGTQTKFDRSLTHVCHLLHCERDQLNVISSSKGLLMGDLILLPSDETVIDCRHQTLLIAESLTTSRPISTAKFILVIEKDATFQKLIDDQYFKQFPNSILVTGKGYPDICTRKFLRWLITILNIPIYGIFDADPHGTEIYLTYKYGSTSEKVEGRSAFVRNIRWLGVKPSEIVALGVDDSQFIPLLNRDYTKITRVLKRAKSLGEEDLVQELENLRKQKHKFEIEAISSMSADYFLLFYLKPKLEHL